MSRSYLRTALHVVATLVLVAVVAGVVLYAVPGVVGAEASFVVLSGSMEPTISPGDVVIVNDVPASKIDDGDVVTFYRGEENRVPTTHRVVKVVETESGRAFVTKGDANPERDPGRVRPEQIVGRVMFVVPYIGYLIQFANTPEGFFALLLFPFAALAATEGYNFVRGRRDGDGTREFELPEDGDIDDGTSGFEVPEDGGAEALPIGDVGEDDDDGTGGLTLTREDVRLTAVAMAVFTAYAGFVAWRVLTPWAVAVAVGGVVGTGLAVGLYRSAGSRNPAEDSVEVVTESSVDLPTDATYRLPSLSAVTAFARQWNHPVIHDDEREVYVTLADGIVYEYDPDAPNCPRYPEVFDPEAIDREADPADGDAAITTDDPDRDPDGDRFEQTSGSESDSFVFDSEDGGIDPGLDSFAFDAASDDSGPDDSNAPPTDDDGIAWTDDPASFEDGSEDRLPGDGAGSSRDGGGDRSARGNDDGPTSTGSGTDLGDHPDGGETDE